MVSAVDRKRKIILNSCINLPLFFVCILGAPQTPTANLFVTNVFTITVVNVNEAPTAILLTGNSVQENKPAGTVIGTLSATDDDSDQTYTYSIVTAGSSNEITSIVAINGDKLQTASVLNFETSMS